MDASELMDIIRRHGLAYVVSAMTDNPTLQAVEGWDLSTWRAQQVAGATLLYRVEPAPDGDGDVVSGDPAVLVVNAPESDRARWERQVEGHDPPVHVLMLPADAEQLRRQQARAQETQAHALMEGGAFGEQVAEQARRAEREASRRRRGRRS